MVISSFCSKRLTTALYDNGKINPELKDAYQYILELAMDFVMFHGSLLIIGLVTGHLSSTIIYLFTLTPLKILSGGAHARTPLMCSIISYAFFFLVAILMPDIHVSPTLSFWAILLLGLCIFRLAPVNHPNKQFSDSQKKRIRRALLIYLVLGTIINLILLITRASHLLFIALCCYLITYINQFIGLILYREVNGK